MVFNGDLDRALVLEYKRGTECNIYSPDMFPSRKPFVFLGSETVTVFIRLSIFLVRIAYKFKMIKL